MNVLVTGASGFVGSAIVAELLQRGYAVRVAVRRAEQAARFGNVSSAIIGDLAQPIDWAPHLDGIDAVVHAAGLAHAPTKAASRQLAAVNVEATDRLMRAAKQAGVAHAIHISSVRAIAGGSCDDVIEEDHRPEPTNAYGRSKLESERAVMASGLGGVILRPPLVHGAHVRGNLALLARVAATALPLPLGGLNARRSIVSDRNLASAVAFLLERPHAQMITALVADAAPLSASEIVAKLRAGIGRTPRLIAVPGLLSPLFAALGQRQLWQSLAGRLELAPRRLAALGWRPVESSDAGLARTIKALRSTDQAL
jgi:nucleoside-diphosphate-sugar epimerase